MFEFKKSGLKEPKYKSQWPSEVCQRLKEPWFRVDNSDQTVGYLIETDEFYSKLSQNVENFQPNLIPNLAEVVRALSSACIHQVFAF